MQCVRITEKKHRVGEEADILDRGVNKAGKIISLQPVIPEIVARMGGLKGLFEETHDRESQNS